ncbi:hypothetical protein [Methylophaga sp.]|uniref:hypothetical protein n=1 Tax=Methylophaga sp. TaxID=2024840 RepID=UPI0014004802|nr:hypothetical protein [Methylophaga sp.]MTI63620.1 hypothetical protein [Methylophaga sp.]
MNLRNLIFLLLIGMFVWQCRAAETVTLGAGVKVPAAPEQAAISSAETFEFNDYLITPLADFSLEAKVLSREDYFLDRESDLAPTDLALGWQQMSDESVLSQIDISQSGRWYHWRVEDFPIPRKAIETQSANMHMVPADEHVAVMLDMVKPGQLIKLEGQLILAESYDGWRWKSSLSREDTGASACELVYVTALEILSP